MVINISKDASGRIIVFFSHDLQFVAKVKTIEGRKWHPDKKYWTVPYSEGVIEKILEVFDGEDIHLDPALKSSDLDSSASDNPTLEKGGKGGFSDKIGSSAVSGHDFDDLKRELLSRKHSCKTVKGYLYYNRDFLSFVKKEPADVRESDIKDYLLHLAEEKQSATSTLNQAINALKFYYGSMLKRKFLYEIKRPRKDKKTACCSKQRRSYKNPQCSG
jgi:hypothetical protein